MKATGLWAGIAAVAANLFLNPCAAEATMLSPGDATISLSVGTAQFQIKTSTSPGTITASACVGSGCESATATASFLDRTPFASASGWAHPSSPGSIGEAIVTFQFELLGPSGLVPLLLNATATTSASTSGGFAAADAAITVNRLLPTLQFLACSATSSVCGSEPPSFTGPFSFSTYANEINTVEVTGSGHSSFSGGTWSVSVDPWLEIDPAFSNSAQYTLLLSPDLAATPESPTLVVVCLGVLGIVLLHGVRTSRSRLLP
jgi:hypothetical protein